MSFFIYKYTQDENIVYIGKTKNLTQRIKQHEQEDKFKNGEFSIYYFLCKNETEMNAYEYFLINKYLPALNVSCKNSISIKIEEPGWILWTGAYEEKKDQADENKIFDNYDRDDLISVSEYAKFRDISTTAVYKQLKTKLKDYLVEINGRKFLQKTVLDNENFKQINQGRDKIQCELDIIKTELSQLKIKVKQQEYFIQQISELCNNYNRDKI